MYVCLSSQKCMYVCLEPQTHACMYVRSPWACMYVCMTETSKHVCMYICFRLRSMYVCMSQTYIHTYIQTWYQVSVAKSSLSEGPWACMYVWKPSACPGKWNLHAQTYSQVGTKMTLWKLLSVYVCLYVSNLQSAHVSEGVRFLTKTCQYLTCNSII